MLGQKLIIQGPWWAIASFSYTSDPLLLTKSYLINNDILRLIHTLRSSVWIPQWMAVFRQTDGNFSIFVLTQSTVKTQNGP